MNPLPPTSPRPSRLRFAGSLLAVLAATSMATNAATEEITMALGSKSFGNGVALKATSGTQLIQESKLYTYKITAKVRGKGDLAAAVPVEIALDKLLESLKPGSSSILSGSYSNPTGALPVTLISKSLSASGKINNVPVSLKLKLTGKISSTGQLSLGITNVQITSNSTPVAGTIAFAKGSNVKVSTAPIVEFMAQGQPSFQEPASGVAYANVTVWRLGNVNKAASAKFTTVNGTALAGVDYTATTGTVKFGAGVTEKTIQVPLIPNPTGTTNNQFTIVLSNPGTGTVLGGRLVNTVTIKSIE